jgi:CheY-like chemotaxis protein
MKRILVVDDDPLLCSAIRGWLEERGFSVVIADGGETGLAALGGSTFDLMIVDIFMPNMHGFESVRVFHQRAPMVPLIAISGYVFAEERMPAPDFLTMALGLGATHCLRKPFTPKTLLTVIDMCLSESETLKVKSLANKSEAKVPLSISEAKQDEGSMLVGIIHELTERKRTEELCAQVQETEMVDQVTGGIAHDLNTLLTVIVGNAEFLSEKLDAREDLRQLAHDIARAGDRGAELTQRLMAFDRRRMLHPVAIDASICSVK